MLKIARLEPTQAELGKLKGDHYYIAIAALAGENYRELAYNFGLPIGTVKSRLNRATAKLLENRKNAATANVNP